MNNVLFSNLIALVSTMDDKQMSTMLGYAVQITGTKTKNAKTIKADKAESRMTDKDVDVKFTTNKNILSMDGYVAKDVFGVIKHELETMGIEYVKGSGFKFKTAKDAKAYMAKRVKVTAKERNTFRKDVYGWA